ncbi:hypothetical protein [Actinomyces wuliandei]|nr:hypothetical protein [Actinomyces wuliandei]
MTPNRTLLVSSTTMFATMFSVCRTLLLQMTSSETAVGMSQGSGAHFR